MGPNMGLIGAPIGAPIWALGGGHMGAPWGTPWGPRWGPMGPLMGPMGAPVGPLAGALCKLLGEWLCKLLGGRVCKLLAGRPRVQFFRYVSTEAPSDLVGGQQPAFMEIAVQMVVVSYQNCSYGTFVQRIALSTKQCSAKGDKK